jgi:hypothetical protein
MPFTAFKISLWGPKRLRAIFTEIEDAINTRAPLEGCGIRLSQQPDGREISADIAKGGDDSSVAAGGGGSPVDIYGAFNGAPAVFHLKQTAPPTVPPP